MKKFEITVSLGIIIICVLLMILLGLRPRDEDIPWYRFLGGRIPTFYTEFHEKSRAEDILYTYSFEADFNDVCLNANTELISAGFVDRTLPSENFRKHTYWLKKIFHRRSVLIVIHNNQYIEHPISKDGALSEKDGWIVVEISYWRGWRLF